MVTLNVAIAIFGNLSSYLNSATTDDTNYQHEVAKIAGCASFLTFYFIFIPLALYGLIWILGAGKFDPEYFYLISIYGYSFTPFLPAVLLYIIPVETIKWALLLTAGGISIFFLAKELFGRISQCLETQHVKMVSGGMLGLHLLFILVLKWKFL